MNIDEYRTKELELFENNNIPIEFRSFLSHMAYEIGHAYSYDEVFIHLQDFVYGIKDPIKTFEKRIREDSASWEIWTYDVLQFLKYSLDNPHLM